MKLAAETEWVDVILARINPFGVKMDGAPEDVAAVLQTAHANDKAVFGHENRWRRRVRGPHP